MRQTVSNVLMALTLVVGGCGGFDNSPFRTGTVRGRLTEANPTVALVSLVGNPGVRSTVAEDGSFMLERVPAGPVELFIVASADKATRLRVVVPGGGSARLEDVAPRAAGFLELRVQAPARQRVGDGQVSVVGTPFQRLRLEEDGGLRVGPLPEGCYALEASVPGFRVKREEVCVGESERKDVALALPVPDADSASGCAVTGCERGTHCASDGRCVECVSDGQCASGFTCRNERCEGPGPSCATCDGDWKCRPGTRCQDVPEGSAACVSACDSAGRCAPGFTCQGGRCLPEPAQLAGCFAYRQVGMPCDGDERCRDRGISQGLCVEGTCTFRCTADAECPEGFTCTPSATGAICRPGH
jgi:Cys-rich repeat protein